MNCKKFQQIGQEIHDSGVFVGCPLSEFSASAADPLEIALAEGLQPNHKVLEVGCRCLRVGFWFVNYLDPKRYCGIEPNVKMLEAGLKYFRPDINGKKGRLDYNDQFDFSVFKQKFNYIVAFSIWTHASKVQIEKMLDQFVEHSTGSAKFITSYLPAGKSRVDYRGNKWVGKSHKSKVRKTVAHNIGWLVRACFHRKLCIKFLSKKTINQRWLVISKK